MSEGYCTLLKREYPGSQRAWSLESYWKMAGGTSNGEISSDRNRQKPVLLEWEGEWIHEGKGVWQRKEDRCVFREGEGEWRKNAKSSFMLLTTHTSPPFPPCGIFLHEWLSYLGDKIGSHSVPRCLSHLFSPYLASCMSVLCLHWSKLG